MATDFLTRIVRGLRWSERYGHHPGTVPLVALVVLGGIAGGPVGAAVMLAVFVPFYLHGAWERGDGD